MSDGAGRGGTQGGRGRIAQRCCRARAEAATTTASIDGANYDRDERNIRAAVPPDVIPRGHYEAGRGASTFPARTTSGSDEERRGRVIAGPTARIREEPRVPRDPCRAAQLRRPRPSHCQIAANRIFAPRVVQTVFPLTGKQNPGRKTRQFVTVGASPSFPAILVRRFDVKPRKLPSVKCRYFVGTNNADI